MTFERIALRIAIFVAGAIFGMAVVDFESFFEGPCPDKVAESAARFPIPEPWCFGVMIVASIAMGVWGMVILGRMDKTEEKSDAV